MFLFSIMAVTLNWWFLHANNALPKKSFQKVPKPRNLLSLNQWVTVTSFATSAKLHSANKILPTAFNSEAKNGLLSNKHKPIHFWTYPHTIFAEISAHQKQSFFQGGSTQNQWALMGDFSKGGVHKTDRSWWVLEKNLSLLKIKRPGRLFRQTRWIQNRFLLWSFYSLKFLSLIRFVTFREKFFLTIKICQYNLFVVKARYTEFGWSTELFVHELYIFISFW